MSFSKKELLPLITIILVASFLRLYRIDELPPALHGDEAFLGVLANRVLAGEGCPLYFAENYGEEPIYVYLIVLLFWAFGLQPLIIRGLSAALGIATIPILYLCVKELCSEEQEESSLSLPGLLAASWLALSYWHVSYSRLGLQPILMPLCTLLTFYFLWRGLRSKRRLHFGLAGLLLGITMYTYQASRFVPFVILLFVVYRSLTDKDFINIHGRNVILLFAIAFLIFAPLGYYYLTHPEVFFWRASDVSIFNPRQEESPWEALLLSTARTAGMFNVQGDRNWRHNLAGRPAFDALSSICFLAGLGISMVRFKRSRYFFLLLWLVVMSSSLILNTPRDVPHFSRAIGALPAACIFPAIGVQGAWQWLKRKRPALILRRVFWASVGLLLICATVLSYRDYFISWAGHENLRDHWFDGQFSDLAMVMNELDQPDGVWILPIDTASSLYGEPGHYVVDFLYRGTALYHFVALDEETAAEELTRISQGRDRALVVQYRDYTLDRAYEYIDADPKRFLPFLLGKYGQLLAHHEFEGFDILIYDLPEVQSFAIARSFEPVSFDFGNELALTGVAYGGSSQLGTSTSTEVEQATLPSGKNAWVVLRWEALAAPSRNYKVGVYLLDGQERTAGQVDKLLLSNNLHPTRDWQVGQEEMDYYTLPSLPATPPGEYKIQVVVYDAETMERLTTFDQREGVTKSSLVVGALQLIKPAVPPQVEPMEKLVGAERNIALGIRLLGYDLPVRAVGPGETLRLALYWQALEDVSQDYLLSLALRDSEGKVRIEQKGRPVDDTYPTTEWDEGEVLRDWHDLALPADMPQGVYEIFLGVLEGEELLGEVALGRVEVRGRARQFAMPEMQRSLEARLGEKIQFLGYDLSSNEVRPGETLQLTLYWQALEEMEVSYTVFTHLLDAEDHIWGQMDGIPDRGEAPTTSWVEGEVITDEYEIVVDPEAPPGEYIIEIGMYDASTGQRLPVWSDGEALGEDRLLLETVQVVP